MVVDWSLLIGLVAIAVAVYFGLRELRKDTGERLSEIRDKVLAMGVTLDNAWDVLKMRFVAGGGTVERNLRNLGRARISAKPSTDGTLYTVDVEKPLLQAGLISKLSQSSGFVDTEHRFFGGANVGVSTPLPTRLSLRLPCTEAQKCTEFMSLLLQWLDSTYYSSLGKDIADYEEPIVV